MDCQLFQFDAVFEDLLALDPFEGIPMVGAAGFLAMLDRSSDKQGGNGATAARGAL